MTGRYSWLSRLRWRGRSFADESAWLSDSLMLAIEAQHVMSLRLAAIARGGPTAEAETRLMVTEKMVAALTSGRDAGTGSIDAVGDFILSVAGARKCAKADAEASAASPR